MGYLYSLDSHSSDFAEKQRRVQLSAQRTRCHSAAAGTGACRELKRLAVTAAAIVAGEAPEQTRTAARWPWPRSASACRTSSFAPRKRLQDHLRHAHQGLGGQREGVPLLPLTRSTFERGQLLELQQGLQQQYQRAVFLRAAMCARTCATFPSESGACDPITLLEANLLVWISGGCGEWKK